MEMNEALIYLQEALGLSAKAKIWPGSARLPLHLRAIEARAVDANDFRFCLQVCLLASGFPRLRESIVSYPCARRLLLSFRFLMPMHVSAKH